MTTDIVPAGAAISRAPNLRSYGEIGKFAAYIQDTEFVPKDFRRQPDKIFAAIAWGAEAGLGPMQSLRGVQIIKGQVGPKPELARALVMQRGHTFDVVEWDDEHCTVHGKRADSGSELTLTYTLDMAVTARLVTIRDGKPYARSSTGEVLPWEKHPRRMVLARATGDLTAALFPDVVAGLSYMADELAEIAGVDYDVPDTEIPAGGDLAGEPPDPEPAESGSGEPFVDAEVVESHDIEPDAGDVVESELEAGPPLGVDPDTGEMRSVHDQLIAEVARLKGPAKVQFIKWLNEQRFPSLPAHMDDEQATAALAHLTGSHRRSHEAPGYTAREVAAAAAMHTAERGAVEEWLA